VARQAVADCLGGPKAEAGVIHIGQAAACCVAKQAVADCPGGPKPEAGVMLAGWAGQLAGWLMGC
jgi:hypothetical protein